MDTASDSPASRLEIVAALSCVALCLAAAWSDIHILHPGIAWPDEWDLPLVLQQAKEGLALPLGYAKGSLHRGLLALFSLGSTPSLGALHAPLFLLFPLENFFLYSLGRRHFGPKAGLGAVAANCLASFTLLRLRSILAYSLLPFELTALLWALPYARKAGWAMGLGLLSALMLLEYEAWVPGLAVLGLAAYLGNEAQRPRLGYWLLGLACGLAVVAAVSLPDFSSYLAQRASHNSPAGALNALQSLAQGLRGYWFGAASMGYLGVKQSPAFPLWAWLPLALGIGLAARQQRWILGWLLLGLLPLVSLNSAIEPQRAIVAWPALCLLAGAGAAWLAARSRWAGGLLALLAFWGLLREGQAYASSMQACYGQVYGASEAVLEEAAALEAHRGGQAYQVLTEFDNESAASLRFLFPCGTALQPGQAGLRLALLPREYCLKKNGLKGTWLAVPDIGPCLFLPDAATWARLQKVDAELGALWRALPRYQRRRRAEACVAYYFQHPQADPWVKTACLEQAFGASFLIGEFPLDLLKKVENENLASASLLLWSADKLKAYDPAWSQRLLQRAHGIDPSKGMP